MMSICKIASAILAEFGSGEWICILQKNTLQ
jgi:hypothetical protein